MSALEEDIAGAGYKILKTLDKLRYKVIDTTDEGFEDDCFININDMEEFRRISGHMRCGIR
jgi:molybdopterin-guanine dinucleotide biosynthesis protein A